MLMWHAIIRAHYRMESVSSWLAAASRELDAGNSLDGSLYVGD